MSRSIEKFEIFLASPSDLKEERNAVEDVVNEINSNDGERHNYIVEVRSWEKHSVPGVAKNSVQELVNKDLGNSYDIFIGMFWTKYGTPTSNADSGTREEFDLAWKRKETDLNVPKILFYFKTDGINPLDINPWEIEKIKNFRSELQEKNVLFAEFDTVEVFKKYLRLHISKKIHELRAENDSQTSTIQAGEKNNVDEGIELGLLDYKENFQIFIENSSHSMNMIVEHTEWISNEISKSAKNLTRFNNVPNPDSNVIKVHLHKAAKSMDDYSKRLESETPVFYENFEKFIDSGIGILNVLSDFKDSNSTEELEETKSSIETLESGMIEGISSLEIFELSVSQLPRIEQRINKSRQTMSRELNKFIDKLKDLLKLLREFGTQIDITLESRS